MGSVAGTESDSTLKMRLTPIFALIILSCLLLNLTSAQRSASRKTTKNNNCRGSSSRSSSSRPSSSRPSSSRGRGSTGGRGSAGCGPNNQKPTQEEENQENPNLSRNPLRKFKLPKKKRKSISTSGNTGSSGNPSRKFKLPKKKVKPTPNESSDEETDSGSSTRRKIKTSAKKYLQKVKDKLKNAAVWYLENKDKTIDDILVDKWKKKCPGGISTKKKRKQCVSEALAESDDDTPEEKEIKDALKSLVEEDSDGAYDFLSKSSLRTFGDIENEEEIQDKLSEMPEKFEKLWEEDKSKTFTELETE